ncbi:MAG: hypothetical protein R3A44_24590 [Caldilineaceae bacterium]
MLHKLMPTRIKWYLAACILLGLSAFHMMAGGQIQPVSAQTIPDIEVKMTIFLPIAQNEAR